MQCLLRETSKSIAKVCLYGLFSVCILAHIWAFFGGISKIFYITISVLSFLSIVYNYTILIKSINVFKLRYLELSVLSKISIFFLLLLTLAQSSTSPFVIDNESYYIQTIKWINGYGFVKGLANLHVYLAQCSGWHVLQSAFSFPFLAIRFNDLNGFLYLLFGVFSILRLEDFRKSKDIEGGIIGVLLSLTIFFYLFIDAPSPDLPVFLISQLLIYFFLKSFGTYSNSDIMFVCVLALFLILIKVTIFPIIILPAIIFTYKNIFLKERLIVLFSISLVTLFVFIGKNYVLSGYPLFPLTLGSSFLKPDWQLNIGVLNFYLDITKVSGYPFQDYKELPFLTLIVKWLSLPGLKGILHKFIGLLVCVSPFFIKSKKVVWVYVYCVIQFGFLLFACPLYRFLMPIVLFMAGLIFVTATNSLYPYYKYFVLCALLIAGIPVVFGFDVNKISENKWMNKKEAFKYSQILVPESVTKYPSMRFELKTEGNLDYYSPIVSDKMMYLTGDGNLPTVQKRFIDYLKLYHNHVPQLRVKGDLEKGFYGINAK